MQETDEACLSHRQTLARVKNKKLYYLRTKNDASNEPRQTPIKFYTRVMNLSTVTFNKAESALLDKGLKFAVPPSHPSSALDNLETDLMVGLKNNDVAASRQPMCSRNQSGSPE